MPKPKTKPIGVELPLDLYKKARRLADADDRSIASLVRKLLAEAPEPTAFT
jgi:hypothetical protein